MATGPLRCSLALRPLSRRPDQVSRIQTPQPWLASRSLQTTHQFVEQQPPVETPSMISRSQEPREATEDPTTRPMHAAASKPTHSPIYDLTRAPAAPSTSATATRGPLNITESLRAGLSNLLSQPPFYARIHIHGMPYLVTAGDRVRLPFLMHGVMPGDILRLDRVTSIGSRDWTLVGGTNFSSKTDSEAAAVQEPIIGRTDGLPDTPYPRSSTTEAGLEAGLKKKGPRAYLDDRLFVCRATVLGTETEPMRVMEKTKRRQRHTKHVKSKHRYTVLRITDIEPRTLTEMEDEAMGA